MYILGPSYSISYDEFAVDVGGGLNLSNGFFTAPVGGIYQFGFFGQEGGPDQDSASVFIKKNLKIMAYGSSGDEDYYATVSLNVYLELEEGDLVNVGLSGFLMGDNLRRIHFTGQLVGQP